SASLSDWMRRCNSFCFFAPSSFASFRLDSWASLVSAGEGVTVPGSSLSVVVMGHSPISAHCTRQTQQTQQSKQSKVCRRWLGPEVTGCRVSAPIVPGRLAHLGDP